jgi:hypothetical protein
METAMAIRAFLTLFTILTMAGSIGYLFGDRKGIAVGLAISSLMILWAVASSPAGH